MALHHHRDDEGPEAAGQIHAAGQDGPPRPELGGFKPLQAEESGGGGRVGAGWGLSGPTCAARLQTAILHVDLDSDGNKFMYIFNDA